MPDRRWALKALGVFALAASAGKAANIPRNAPEFVIQLPNGQQAKLSQYKGKVVALSFILTSCSHCQKAVRALIQSQGEFGGRGFQALASAIEDMASLHVAEFARQFRTPFPVGFNAQRQALDFMQHPPMVGPIMPLMVFIDRQGVIRAQYEGHEPFLAADQLERNIRSKILELLDEPPPGGPPPAKHRKKQS